MPRNKRQRREHQPMRMDVMEPRMLLSADLLALAGLPGVDNSEEDAPWDQVPVTPADLIIDSAGNGVPVWSKNSCGYC